MTSAKLILQIVCSIWLLDTEVAPDFGTRGLIGKAAVPLLNGADHDEENPTND